MKLEVCQLTRRQATEYERTGKVSECRHHGHVTLAVAQAWIKRNTHRWVHEGWSIVCDIMHWAAKGAGGLRNLQLVHGVDSGRAPGRKYAIGAHGARGRETKVSQTNSQQSRDENGKFRYAWFGA
jgi:hypothetical protein